VAQGDLTVAAISAEEHLAFIESRRTASFLQTPAWGAVKSEWRHESIGWRDAGGDVVGAGLVLHRPIPRLARLTLAYLPEGPLVDWTDADLGRWLDPMASYLKDRGAFGIRMGAPVVTRRWTAAQVKEGLADPAVRTLRDVPTELDPVGRRVTEHLTRHGWRDQHVAEGFGAGQPQYTFAIPLAGREEDDVLRGMNQLWRRNIKKADKSGVVVTVTDGSSPADQLEADLGRFHTLYVETAARDHFTPRPLSYFRQMLDAMGTESPDRVRLFLATHEGELVAATIYVRVGAHTWYLYGASSTAKRDVRGSNAVQWAMLRAALESGADVYDLRGITSTLDADDSHAGLIQFKVGTGGEAVESVGEWDLALNTPLYKAFDLYMRRRG
jgi:lipid II:glycine glycyltransferase (peptidoglycan interpeptide bridge formation enzyme)